MASASDLLVRPITSHDVDRVGLFLSRTLNPRLSPHEWADAMVPPWDVQVPNHGFMLTLADEVVGVNLAFYSERTINEQRELFCNLGALCVREDLRIHTFRLLRAILKQGGYHFTDLSPSGNVVELNRRLGFSDLDTATYVAPNLPCLSNRRITVITDLDEIDRRLEAPVRQIFRDHRAARAAQHLLVTTQDAQCYVVYRRDRRKKLPLFASILYVSDQEVFREVAPQVARHLLRRGLLATLSEPRVTGWTPTFGRLMTTPRVKMFKSSALPAGAIDYLYSELTCVAW